MASLFSTWTAFQVGVAQWPRLLVQNDLCIMVWAAVQMLPWPRLLICMCGLPVVRSALTCSAGGSQLTFMSCACLQGLQLESVVLMSRDEASMMVVSYADLRRCLDSAYTELKTRANAAKRNRLGHHR